jgi:hypothetical protein
MLGVKGLMLLNDSPGFRYVVLLIKEGRVGLIDEAKMQRQQD